MAGRLSVSGEDAHLGPNDQVIEVRCRRAVEGKVRRQRPGEPLGHPQILTRCVLHLKLGFSVPNRSPMFGTFV